MKTLSVGLLFGGIVFMVFGIAAAQSLGRNVEQLLSGHPADRSIWLLLSGAAMTLAGVVLNLRKPDRS